MYSRASSVPQTTPALRSLLPGTSRLTKELSSAPLSSRAPHPQLRGGRYGIGGGTPARGAGRSGAACPGCAPHAGSGSLPAAAPPREGRGPHLPPAAPALPPPQPPRAGTALLLGARGLTRVGPVSHTAPSGAAA